MSFSHSCIDIFNRAISDYHIHDDVDQTIQNPFVDGIDALLYYKSWIDTVQWHLEDVIRDPDISPNDALFIKRRIDSSNQDRTDRVEELDDYFLENVAAQVPNKYARLNTESPAWAVDRLSILCLKIYHMREEVNRTEISDTHRASCQNKLNILLEQLNDLSSAIDQLLSDIKEGSVSMKLYRQMKMYNDPNLNPVLYKSKK